MRRSRSAMALRRRGTRSLDVEALDLGVDPGAPGGDLRLLERGSWGRERIARSQADDGVLARGGQGELQRELATGVAAPGVLRTRGDQPVLVEKHPDRPVVLAADAGPHDVANVRGDAP